MYCCLNYGHESCSSHRMISLTARLITGLQHVDIGAPLPATARRAKGYDVSLVAILEKPADALIYAEHPAHEA